MNLNLVERLMVFQLLPERGDMNILRLTRDIREKLEFSQEEIEKYKLDFTTPGKVTWDPSTDLDAEGFEITFSKSEIGFLQDTVKELDRSKSIQFKMLKLCEDIMKAEVESMVDGKAGI